MPTIIDSLVVALGLDASGYKKGAKEVEKAGKDADDKISKSKKKLSDEDRKIADEQKKRAKEMQARTKAMGEGMNKLRNQALSLLTVFTAGMGIKNFIESTIDSGASLSRMSKNLHMTAKDLAMYKLANQMAGGSAEGMVAQLQQASEDVSSLQLGKGLTESAQNTLRYAAMYGVSASLSDMKDATTLLKKRADIIATIYKTSPTQAASVAKSMGISDDTFNLMKLGAAGIERLKQSQEGLASSQARNADRAEAFRQKMVDLKNTFSNIALDILIGFMPVLETIQKQLKRFAAFILGQTKGVDNFADKVSRAIVSISNALANVDWESAIKGAGDLLNAVISLVQAISRLANFISPNEEDKSDFEKNADKVLSKAGSSVWKFIFPKDEDKFEFEKSIDNWLTGGASNVGAKTSANKNIASSSSSEVKVGTVNIHTQATDAAGIAKSFGGAMQKYGYPAQANSGIK